MWIYLLYALAGLFALLVGFWLAAAMAYKKIRALEEDIASLLAKQRELKANQCIPKHCMFWLSYKKGKGAA